MASPTGVDGGWVRVWDPAVRIFHWALVVAVAVAWVTHHGPAVLHDWTGYAALVFVAFRVLWGFAGSRYARFRQFIRPPSVALDYLRKMPSHREPRYLGHNPLGGLMVLALLAAVAATGMSGWLYTTDAYWGVEWVEELHEISADILVILIVVHIAGVIFTSRRQRENLATAMITGNKPAPSDGDVT